jgi:uncharacterized phage infection (PIP) family protein YhgE
VRSVRLVLRGDAAHFNRLAVCTKCGREVPGRAVLSPADLDHPAQAVVCNDCVDAATEPAWSGPPAPPAEPVPVDEPALMDAQLEMNRELEELVEELGEAVDEEVPPPVEEETDDLVDEPDDASADDAGLQEDDQPEVATLAVNGAEPPAPADLWPPPVDEVLQVEEPDVDEPPAPADVELVSGQDRPEEDELARRLDVLEERPAGAGAGAGLADLERRIEEAVDRLTDRAEAQAERQAAVQAQVEELGSALAAAQAQQKADKLRKQLDGLVARVEQLQGSIDAEWARAKAESAALHKANEKLANTVATLDQRIEDLGTQLTGIGNVDNRHIQAIERRVEEAVKELRAGLHDGLEDVMAAIPPPAGTETESRLRAMETQVRQGRNEVSELNELHAALDAGLGVLRGEMGELRTGLARLADAKADLEDRLETFVRVSLVPEGEKGRKAKKAAENSLGTVQAAVQDLLREQRQLRDKMTALEQASDGATAAAARAVTQASSLGPIRSEMKLLHQEVAEQNESLEALRKAVDTLRRQAPAPAPAPPAPARPPAAKAPAAKKAAKAAPATKAAATTKGASARAAIARAAATQAAEAKAPAAKRVVRAKKA